MNYLAHAYLSFGDPEILTGNLISDFVKGKKKFDYPQRIQSGIELHRAIDIFTDEHPVNKQVASLFRADYRLYSNAFIDVIYDHFLALELMSAGDMEFEAFSLEVYQKVESYLHLLPETFNNIFPYMKQHNWLYNYQFARGIEKSMEGLVHRARYMSDSNTAFRIFTDNYEELKAAYNAFFPELRNYSLMKFSDIH